MGLQFQFPEYGWLLLLLLPIVGIWAWWERKKAAIIGQMAQLPHLLQTLLINYNPVKSRVRFATYALAFAGVVLSILNPRVVQETANSPMEGSQVMLAIDVSNSMLATDVAPNRLEKARTFAIRLSEAMGGNRIGVLAFAGEARLQMPPSGDLGAVQQAIQTLSTKSIPLQGTNIEAALDVSLESLTSDALAWSAVVLITDGEELEGGALQKAREYGRQGLQVFVAGLGTEQGALLTEPESNQPLLDENDQQVLSKAEPALLQKLAQAAGGTYLQVTDLNQGVAELASDLNGIKQRPMANSNLINYYSFAPWILLAVFGLLLWEWIPFSWLSTKAKVKKPALALVTLFLLMLGTYAHAQKANATLEQAMEAFRAGRFEDAASACDKALELEPGNTEAFFYKALSEYKLGRYDEAAKLFMELAARKPANEVFLASLNNAGLALAGAKKLPEAINAFKQALKASPEDAGIRQNLQKAIMDQKAALQPSPEENKEPEPPMEKEDANKKLQSLMEDERRTREKMKPRPVGGGNGKNW
jgi:Ca-activated chloride channel family protein